MRGRSVKLNNWPFEKGERAKVIWISSLFWHEVIEPLLRNLVTDSGVWLKESLIEIEENGITIQKSKHSKKNYEHRASLVINKFN
ncbi:hypothetical protein DN401_04040 [Bacillus sp. BF2-3]|uniref:hypothetical protein n=1 Tax=Bacillus sp. BF2-3 TaxID=2217827 RepID=UPI0011EBA3CB|nr:hypothetical protein [Bacillus sp. BF2-3]KAA0757985.1 hypothetical protein DN401_04040 [Bacillus sp. BF2-3]